MFPVSSYLIITHAAGDLDRPSGDLRQRRFQPCGNLTQTACRRNQAYGPGRRESALPPKADPIALGTVVETGNSPNFLRVLANSLYNDNQTIVADAFYAAQSRRRFARVALTCQLSAAFAAAATSTVEAVAPPRLPQPARTCGNACHLRAHNQKITSRLPSAALCHRRQNFLFSGSMSQYWPKTHQARDSTRALVAVSNPCTRLQRSAGSLQWGNDTDRSCATARILRYLEYSGDELRLLNFKRVGEQIYY